MYEDAGHHHGFKKLTVRNWQQPDTALRGFCRKHPDGYLRPISADDYAEDFLHPDLSELVPTDIRALYEVGRGALLYGFLFYPMYSLGAQQLCRVAEAAAKAKCHSEGVAKSTVRTFGHAIKCLRKRELLDHDQELRWQAMRELRNMACHPSNQEITTPGSAMSILCVLTDWVNRLFDPQAKPYWQPQPLPDLPDEL